jgi:hypothetical protein
MSTYKKVLEEINRGVPPEILAQKIPWEKLNNQDLVELIKITRTKADLPDSYNLLDYLFRVSREKDLWFSVEVLSNAVQYQRMSLEDRSSILLSMRKRLDQIKDKISAEMPSDSNLRRYWLFEAAYYAVSGATLSDSNRTLEALQFYQIARGIFEQLGLTQQVDKYTDIIHRLNGGTTGQLNRKPINFFPPSVNSTSMEPEKKASGLIPGGLKRVAAHTAVESQPMAFRHKTGSLMTPVTGGGAPAPTSGDDGTAMPATVVKSNGAAAPTNGSNGNGNHATSSGNGNGGIAAAAVGDAPIHPSVVNETLGTLPSSYLDEKREPVNGTKIFVNDETARRDELIQQQNEILTEIKLEVQMYLSRRALLAREVQNLEKKVEALKLKLDRLEKKEKLLDPEQVDQA